MYIASTKTLLAIAFAALCPSLSSASRRSYRPDRDLTDHCEQDLDDLPYSLSIQEVQSPDGARHSAGILSLIDGKTLSAGTDAGLVWFSNEYVEPEWDDDSTGYNTGHCIQVSAGEERFPDGALACYFNFYIDTRHRSGRITAEALFPLHEFPNANMVITGGTGDFSGIFGSACVTKVEDDKPSNFPLPENGSFVVNFNYDLANKDRHHHRKHSRAGN